MGYGQMIQDIKEARKSYKKETGKSVEECLLIYMDILEAASKGELISDQWKYPGGCMSDLHNAGYLLSNMWPSRKGKDILEGK